MPPKQTCRERTFNTLQSVSALQNKDVTGKQRLAAQFDFVLITKINNINMIRTTRRLKSLSKRLV